VELSLVQASVVPVPEEPAPEGLVAEELVPGGSVAEEEPASAVALLASAPAEEPAPSSPVEAAQIPAPAEPALEPAAEAEVQSPVNYDDEGIGEVEIDGQIYRFDSGKQGTALCLSLRRDGAWRWSYLGELRWDGRDLRSKALDRSLLTRLSVSLRSLAEQAI
jgi:hypothetical protein